MTVNEKLRKAIQNFTKKNAPMSPEDQLACAGTFLTASLAYSDMQRNEKDLVSEMRLLDGMKWLSGLYTDPESHVLGATDFSIAAIQQMHNMIVNDRMKLTDAIDLFSVLLCGLVMLGSTTDDPVKKAAQCDAIAHSIRTNAMKELSRIYGPLGEMN